jgi:GDP/UDP-N,N'-diacetylbacillosamine 2-epimerase (hydrolysing)
MTQKRRILGVTGIRSEYDIMSSVFKAISEHPALQLSVAVTGAHLSEAYGYTVREIRADGFDIADEIESLLNGDQESARVKGLAIQLQGLTQTIGRIRPDILLVLGDREESITTALAGAYMNIPVAHVAGGDRVVGNVDDHVRHAVTKLAHLHFVTNQESFDRVLRLGEQPFRVYNTGNPGLDRLLSVPELTAAELSSRLGFAVNDGEPLILLIQHVLSSEISDAYPQMKQTLEAVKEMGIRTIVSYPNSDAGGDALRRAIHEYEHLPFLYTARNIPRLEFVNLVRRASCMLGNSSAGIMEAPLLNLPVINVGNRQTGRLHAGNVEFVAHDAAVIRAAVQRAIYDLDYRAYVRQRKNPYGDGKSSVRIADILATVAIDKQLLVKDITY